MKKGDLFIAQYNKAIYKVAGRWGSDIVLVDNNEENDVLDQVLIYSPSEIEELLSTGMLHMLDEARANAPGVTK